MELASAARSVKSSMAVVPVETDAGETPDTKEKEEKEKEKHTRAPLPLPEHAEKALAIVHEALADLHRVARQLLPPHVLGAT